MYRNLILLISVSRFVLVYQAFWTKSLSKNFAQAFSKGLSSFVIN